MEELDKYLGEISKKYNYNNKSISYYQVKNRGEEIIRPVTVNWELEAKMLREMVNELEKEGGFKDELIAALEAQLLKKMDEEKVVVPF